MGRSRAAAAVTLMSAICIAVAGCTSNKPTVTDTTLTQTVTHTASSAVKAIPAATVAPLPPDAHPAAGQVEKKCPYIGSNFTDGTPNVADIEGNRVYRTTVITTMKPVGCRFYFWAPPYEATADIVTYRYATATDAQNAMALTARAGKHPETVPNLLPGVTGVLFQTRFFAPDGADDWACAFTKGSLLVIVHIHQTNASFSAKELAAAVAPKI